VRGKLLTILTAVVAALALAGAATAIVLNPRTQVNSLKRQLATTEGRLTTANGRIARLQASSQVGTVATLQTQMHRVMMCIPQVESQIDGLSINWRIDPVDGSNDYFNIANGEQVSTDCSKVLYGTSS